MKARAEATRKRLGDRAIVPDKIKLVEDEAVDAFSIQEFCRRHRISVQIFYKLRDQMPRTFSVGSRVLISREAAARWRQEREEVEA